MFLTQSAEYALRAMTVITLERKGRPLQGQALARLTGISAPYLSKVLRRLVRGKLLMAQRGAGGGFVLARPPGKISFGDILKAAGFRLDESHCVFGWRRCNARHPCPLHPSWRNVKVAFQRWTEQTKLGQVSRP